ncbi:hypothetical protein RCO48_09280 [Peribacillus frigoritolerans]|nr:hypothetical protein [Peribacillus frigoritolerans]
MTDTGREVYTHRLEYDDLGNAKKVKLDNGFFTAFKEKILPLGLELLDNCNHFRYNGFYNADNRYKTSKTIL